jgi:hypothetical protein
LNLEDVVTKIKESPSSLFYGTGICQDCGGPSWDELLSDLQKRFQGESSNDPFDYLEEIIQFDNSNRAEIEDYIRTRLSAISPQDDQKYLFSIPWRAVLTTNYDHLPDAVNITLDGSRQIIPISDPSEQIDHTRVDRLYTFKLLGDVKYSFSEGGWMVLSESDLFSASERRTVFFNHFRNLAKTGHIIYMGYSFKDNLVFRLLNHMKTVLGKFPWKGFAITPSEPDEKTRRKLKAIGITWIKGDLKEFVIKAKEVFGEIPKSSPVQFGCITIHRQTLEIDLR